MKKIVVKRADGGVSIIIPSADATNEAIERDALRTEGYVSHRQIDDEQLPTSRAFRDAWTDDNPTETVDVDIVKAKAIKLDNFRKLRKPLLEKLDIEYMLALEKNDTETMQLIADKKQKLRDITKETLPSKINALETFMPSALLG